MVHLSQTFFLSFFIIKRGKRVNQKLSFRHSREQMRKKWVNEINAWVVGTKEENASPGKFYITFSFKRHRFLFSLFKTYMYTSTSRKGLSYQNNFSRVGGNQTLKANIKNLHFTKSSEGFLQVFFFGRRSRFALTSEKILLSYAVSFFVHLFTTNFYILQKFFTGFAGRSSINFNYFHILRRW